MREVRLARVLAVDVDSLSDIRRNAEDCLHDWVLEDQKPFPLVPGQSIHGPLSFLLLWHLESAEEELPLAVMRADELKQEQEEVAQRKRLHDVRPWRQVEVGRGDDLADELDDRDHGDQHADPEDLELLVGLGEVCRMSEHEKGNREECERRSGPGNDGPQLMERVAARYRVSGRFKGLMSAWTNNENSVVMLLRRRGDSSVICDDLYLMLRTNGDRDSANPACLEMRNSPGEQLTFCQRIWQRACVVLVRAAAAAVIVLVTEQPSRAQVAVVYEMYRGSHRDRDLSPAQG